MGSLYFFILLLNCFLVSFIFWAITFLFLLFTKNSSNKDKYDIFECGFLSIGKTNISAPVNVLVAAAFIITYESEFILLVPAFFNLFNSYFFFKILIFLLFFFVLFTVFLDVFYKSVFWVY